MPHFIKMSLSLAQCYQRATSRTFVARGENVHNMKHIQYSDFQATTPSGREAIVHIHSIQVNSFFHVKITEKQLWSRCFNNTNYRKTINSVSVKMDYIASCTNCVYLVHKQCLFCIFFLSHLWDWLSATILCKIHIFCIFCMFIQKPTKCTMIYTLYIITLYIILSYTLYTFAIFSRLVKINDTASAPFYTVSWNKEQLLYSENE